MPAMRTSDSGPAVTAQPPDLLVGIDVGGTKIAEVAA
jgi:hypothetical protein